MSDEARRVEQWLDDLAEQWDANMGAMSRDLTPAEAEVVHAKEGERYLRLATGGWSENEHLLDEFRDRDHFCWFVTHRLSAAGGLHIFRYPRDDA